MEDELKCYVDRYYTLINIILNNLRIGILDDAIIREDRAVLEFIKAVEPQLYENKILELTKKSEEEQHIPTIE